MGLPVRSITITAFLVLAGSVSAQPNQERQCAGILFSTSEDFESQSLSSNAIISDGDLLALQGRTTSICRRNAELLRAFEAERDLGLDAVHAVRSAEGREPRLIAFSTELDDPAGRFGAGDLLFTNGAIVPHVALTAHFDLPRDLDLGLDAVELEGQPEALLELAGQLREVGPERLRQEPEILRELLREFEVDILFSTEGTGPTPQRPLFLDGDLLSARDAVVVRKNASLLSSLPVGIPGGADFGLDAYTTGVDPIEFEPIELFSTEIVNKAKPAFTDGDALLPGPRLYLQNLEMLATLEPPIEDLGLDALSAGSERVACPLTPTITEISGVRTADPGSGGAWINASGFALDTGNGRFTRPFASDIEIAGIVPTLRTCDRLGDIHYKVEYQLPGEPWESIVFTESDRWERIVDPFCMRRDDRYASDAGADVSEGWFSVADYRLNQRCGGEYHELAYWNSTDFITDDNGNVSFRLTLRDTSDGRVAVGSPVQVQIDNETIERNDMDLAAGDISFELYEPTTPDPRGECELYDNQCRIQAEEDEDVRVKVRGHISDEYFRNYSLCWGGGEHYGCTGSGFDISGDSYDSSRSEIGDNGTQPPAARDVYLGTVNLSDAHQTVTGEPLPAVCGFYIRLSAWDRPIVGSFSARANNFGTRERGRAFASRAFCVESGEGNGNG